MTVRDANAIKNLFLAIENLNGIEHYVPSETPDEPLTDRKMMLVPKHLIETTITKMPKEVGLEKRLTDEAIFLVACVNYEELLKIQHPHALEVAILRSLILSRSFEASAVPAQLDEGMLITAKYCKRAEIRLVANPSGIKFSTDGEITEIDAKFVPLLNAFAANDAADYVKMTSLLPIFAGIEFQKTNHHYIANDFYKESYKRHFKSAQIESLSGKFNSVDLIYDSVHWLGPENMNNWMVNLSEAPVGYIPLGIMKKIAPAPAGTALCKTQLAIWRAISVYPGSSGLFHHYATQLSDMQKLSDAIDKDRLSYHVYANLFGKVSKLEDKETTDWMISCSQMAAIAQAFINTVARNTDMARAQALKKHADQNVALFRIAEAAFRGTLRKAERDAATGTVSEAITPQSKLVPARVPQILPAELTEE
jgi:hypothetical protein